MKKLNLLLVGALLVGGACTDTAIWQRLLGESNRGADGANTVGDVTGGRPTSAEPTGAGQPVPRSGIIEARVRNESAVGANVTIRFLLNNLVVHLARLQIAPETSTALVGPELTEMVEFTGADNNGRVLPPATFAYGIDADEHQPAVYVIFDEDEPEPPRPADNTNDNVAPPPPPPDTGDNENQNENDNSAPPGGGGGGSTSTTDCNGNGTDDAADIANGTSFDCNLNLVPDECDLSDGTSHDVNGNGSPDECEDCNSNGMADPLDIELGVSADCNTNHIPDECEPDCNLNGRPDDCDLSGAGVVRDGDLFIWDGVTLRVSRIRGLSRLEDITGAPGALGFSGGHDDGRHMVLDSLGERIFVAEHCCSFPDVYDFALTELDVQPGVSLSEPLGVAMLPNGQILVTDEEACLYRLNADLSLDASTCGFYGPEGVAYDEIHDRIYVADEDDPDIEILDGTTLDFIQTVDFCSSSDGPYWLAVDGSTNRLFAVADSSRCPDNSGGYGIHVFDITSNGDDLAFRETLRGSGGSSDCYGTLAVSEAADRLFAIDYCSDTVDIYDTGTLALLGAVPASRAGTRPLMVAVGHLPGHPSADCNTNGLPDECDIAGGSSDDCNTNGVPDECDVTVRPVFTQRPFTFDNVVLDWSDSNDDSATGVVALPFAVTLGGEVFTHFEQDSNGYVEVLKPGESPYGYGHGAIADLIDSGTPNHTFITAAYDDLSSYYYGKYGYRLEAGRAVFYWETETYAEENYDELNRFEMILFADGRVQWNFDYAHYSYWDNDLFTGVYLGYARQELLQLYRDFIPENESWSFTAPGSDDCNTNGVPDECEPDCNGNGIPDACDIASGDSTDCNTNGMPDECETAFVGGLVGYWPFDGSAADASGTGRDLDLFGGAGFAPGLVGPALDLHGNSSVYAGRSGDDAVFDFADGDFTVQVWVNFNTTAGEQVLIEKFQGSAGPGWTLTKLSSNQLHFYASPGIVLTSAPLTISTGEWHQAVVTRSGTVVDVLWDGSVVVSGSTSAPLPDTSFPLLVGKRNDLDGSDLAVNGRIDEVAIWSRALGVQEIAALYNNGSGGAVSHSGETDCNSNGVLDACDIATGTSTDADTNGVPDECEARPPVLYAVGRWSGSLHVLDPDTGAASAVSSLGSGVTGAFGLSVAPGGPLFALVEANTAGVQLISIHPVTLAVSTVGPIGESLADIAFGADGTLYGVVGGGGQSPGEVVIIDARNAAISYPGYAGSSGGGQSIAYVPGTGALHHAVCPKGCALELVDVSAVNDPVFVGGLQFQYQALTYDTAGMRLLGAAFDGTLKASELYAIDPATGAETPLGTSSLFGPISGVAFVTGGGN